MQLFYCLHYIQYHYSFLSFTSKLSLVADPFLFFEVISITPFLPLSPYALTAASALSTFIERMSSGEIDNCSSSALIKLPSKTYKGASAPDFKTTADLG